MNRIALGLSYNGSFFHGWQSQPDHISVQDTLENAIKKFVFVEDNIRTICAGRTDSGVHATSQVVHFDTELDRNIDSWVRGVNSFLPNNVSLIWAKKMDTEFHARFSAISRTYSYILYCGKIRPALYNNMVGWCIYDLDIGKMKKSSEYLVGVHDFTSFKASNSQSKTNIRHIYKINIKKIGSFIVFKIKANAFLYHMVRNIIGVLIDIGKGVKKIEWMKELLELKNRSFASPTFSPYGLYLSSVEYPSHFNLNDVILSSNKIIPFL